MILSASHVVTNPSMGGLSVCLSKFDVFLWAFQYFSSTIPELTDSCKWKKLIRAYNKITTPEFYNCCHLYDEYLQTSIYPILYVDSQIWEMSFKKQPNYNVF